MKQKFFVVSDIHSYYTPLKKALDEKGFDPNNENHWLIVCGDAFDRGAESNEILKFLMSVERKVLVKGNHDLLLEECCLRGFPYSHDKHNGTTRTVQDISGKYSAYDFANACEITYNKLARYRELLVNYFETQNYIFVHSWIPTHKVDVPNITNKWIPLTKDEWMEDWRNANDVEWEDAMWGNPFKLAEQDLNKTGKILCVGHWHCSVGWSNEEGRSEFGEDAKWDIYKDEKHNVVFLDKCTAHTKELNVLVIEDEFEENWLKKYGDKYGV